MIQKVLFVLASLFLFIGLQAQEKAVMKVVYQAKLRNTVGGSQWNDQMCLSIGRTTSHFYSVNALRVSRMRDSIRNAGGNIQDLANTMDSKGMNAGQSYRVYKNIPSGKITLVDKAGRDRLKTIEDKGGFKWNLVKRDTVIAGHKCRFATTEYHGRKWSAWYAVDIASSDGPWKLHGLPGLILLAMDSSGDYSFSVTEIRNGGKEMIVLPGDNYRECSPKQLMDFYRMKIENPMAFLKSNLPPGMEVSLDGMEKKMFSKKRKACLIEVFEK